MSRARALELHNRLCAGIGEEPKITGEEYEWLMKNASLISPEDRAEYVTRIVRWLRENHSMEVALGQLTDNGKMKKEGNRIEFLLGIPENNWKLGDLYGIELKSLKYTSGTVLRLSTNTLGTAVIELAVNRGREKEYKEIQNVVYYKKYHERIGAESPPGNWLMRNGETHYKGVANEYNRFKIEIDRSDNMTSKVRFPGQKNWYKTKTSVNIREKMGKFEKGTLIVFWEGRDYNRSEKTYQRVNLLHTEVLLQLDTDWIMQQIHSNNIGIELRYGGGAKFDDGGPAWEVKRLSLLGMIFDSPQDRTLDWKCPEDLFNDPTNGVPSETSTLGDSQGQQ